jgi:hypothetical protein
MYPLRILEMSNDDGTVTIKGADTKTKGPYDWSKGSKPKKYEEITRKYFDGLKEIKVV